MTLDVRYHRDHRRYFLYLEAGRGEDGSPQWLATMLTPAESLLWQRGERDFLAKQLRARGIPLPAPDGESWWRKLLRWLAGTLPW